METADIIKDSDKENMTEIPSDHCEPVGQNHVDEQNILHDVSTDDSTSEKPQIEEILSEDVKKQRHEDALELKETGNKLFKESSYLQASDKYTEAIDICPCSFAKTSAVLHSNRAACHVKLDEKEKAIEDCTSALEYDQYYTKARLRRAQTYEAMEKLDEALKDYNHILSYDQSCQQAGEASMRLPAQINERNEKLKEEMFGKLKELGNMCLKPFGLSTDNFKVNQDPNTGGYSVNFQR